MSQPGQCAPRVQGPADMKWEKFFQDPNAWWDNRTTKTNPKQPDFKHKEECAPGRDPNPDLHANTTCTLTCVRESARVCVRHI